MAEEVKHSSYETVESKKDEASDQVAAPPTSVKAEECEAVEASDRGLIDIGGKKEEVEEKKSEEEVIVVPEFEEKVQVCEPEVEVEVEVEVEEKKIEETITGDKKEEEEADIKCEDTAVPIEKCEEVPPAYVEETEDKKGFLDKIKEKLPGGKKPEEVAPPPPPPVEVVDKCATTPSPEAEGKEKKGFLDKIKEKLPGHHPKGEEEKEKQKEGACE